MMVDFRSENGLGFLQHWQSLRTENQLVPAQDTFFDQPHPTYAPYLYIVEVSGQDLLVRLMGTKVVERWGRDKTGESLGLGQPPSIYNALLENARTAASFPCGFQTVIKVAVNNGAEMSLEAIALPLKVKAGRPDRVVAYSEALQTLKYGDQSERYIDLPDGTWIDIGVGVPEEPPLVVNV